MAALQYGSERLFREVVEHGLVVDVNRPHLLHQAPHHPHAKSMRHPSKRGKKQGAHKGHAPARSVIKSLALVSSLRDWRCHRPNSFLTLPVSFLKELL